MKAIKVANHPVWEVPYLPIDPQDVGRSYEAIIRINSQSGKGGIAYILQQDYGLNLPRNLQVEFREDIQRITDEEGKELPSKRIYDRFVERYVTQPQGRIKFVEHHTYADPERKGQRIVAAEITDNGETKHIEGRGNGRSTALSTRSRTISASRCRSRIIRSIRCSTVRTLRDLLRRDVLSWRQTLWRRHQHEHCRGVAGGDRLGCEPRA